MEKVLYLKTISQLKNKPSLKDYSRIYLGSEFCVSFIPGKDDLELCFSLCEEYGITMSLVLPFFTNKDTAVLNKALEIIYGWKEDTEIVINDLGHLKIIKDNFPKLQLSWGRLLTKMKSDDKLRNSRLMDYKLVSADQQHMSDFFLEKGIKRIELSNIQQGICRGNSETDLPASIYVPYVYIATSRKCLSSQLLCSGSCTKTCRSFYLNVCKDKIISGNTIFYINSVIPDNLNELNIDRIIIEKLSHEEVA